MNYRSKESFYTVRLPMWDRSEERRCLVDSPMSLSHEVFSKAFARDRAAFDISLHDGSLLSPLFLNHVVYQEKGQKACPVGYFSDAVPHTNRDSFFAFYMSRLTLVTLTMIEQIRMPTKVLKDVP